jgi:hypothetical protein
LIKRKDLIKRAKWFLYFGDRQGKVARRVGLMLGAVSLVIAALARKVWEFQLLR